MSDGERTEAGSGPTAPTSDRPLVLVTGGTGFVGRVAVRGLLGAGMRVRVVSRSSTLPPDISGAELFIADLTTMNETSAASLLDGVDVVVHCAGELSNEELMVDLHERATELLARAAAGRVAHWVQLSSVGSLGHDVEGTVTPACPGAPAGEYELTKKRGDDAVRSALTASGTTLCVLMPTIVFGPGMRSTALHRLRTAIKTGLFAHVGPRDSPAHYVYVDDVASAVLEAVTSKSTGDIVIQDQATVGELVDEMALLVGRPSPRRRVPEILVRTAFSSQMARVPLPGRAAVRALRSRTVYANQTTTMAWVPRVGWRSGLARTFGDAKATDGLHIMYLTTVPTTLTFFRGHMAHERRLGSRLSLVSSPDDGALGHGRLADVAAEVGARALPLPMSRTISPVSDLRSLARLVRLLRDTKPDVVQTATPKAALLGATAARLARVPVVVVGIFGLPQMTETGWRHRLLDATTRLSTWSAHLVWCDSPSMAAHMRAERLAPRNKVAVLGRGSVGGVDAATTYCPDTSREAGQRVRRELGIPSGSPVLGFVGRLSRDKGMLELGRAWRDLRDRYPEAHLVLVGPRDGELPARALEDLEFDVRAHLVGARSDVSAFLAAMDVYLMPSYREGFCVTNLEAGAMGLPVVATRIPGCVDSVADGVTGTLVPARDADALVEAVDRYLSSPELRARHGTAGRRRALSDFAPATLENELATTYRTLLRRR